MNDKIKYGFITLVVWNLLLILMTILAASVRKVNYSYFFDDGTGGIGIALFILLWSLIWFVIGYHSRKKYVQEKAFYRKMASVVDDTRYNKAFAAYYISKHAKMLMIVFITAIPWYILGYVNEQFIGRDFVVMGSLGVLAAISLGIYKILER